MKRIYFLIALVLFLLCPSQVLSQKLLLPESTNSYGNRLHTDRDPVRMTFKDAADDIYMIGNTESDYTFRDIKIIKLDKDLNPLWEKQLSFDTKLSMDNVKDAFVDSNNNLYVIAAAAYSSNQRTYIVLKFDPQGNSLWEYAFSDLKDPIDYDFSFDLIALDQDDNLHMSYRPRTYEYLKYHFLTFSPAGDIIADFTVDDLFNDPSHGYVYNNHITLDTDNMIHMIYKIELDQAPYQEFRYRKFNASSSQESKIELTAEEINFINTPFAETYTTIKNDSQGNLAFLVPNYAFYKDFMVLYFNTDGTMRYKQNEDPLQDRFLLNYTIDPDNNLLVLSNNRSAGTSDDLELTLQKYNPQGELILEDSDPQVLAASVYLHEDHFSVYTDDGEIITYDYALNRLSQKSLNPINSYSSSINALLSINGNSYFSATTFDKRFPDSEYLSEQNMIMRKTDHEKETAAYTFDGSGTSRVYFNDLRMVDDQYVLSAREKIGPEGGRAGDTKAPQNKYILTYDKDLAMVKEEIVDDNSYTFPDKVYDQIMDYDYESNAGVQYRYTVNTDFKSFSLYKNETFQWTRDLTLTDTEEQGISFVVDKNGDFIVSSSNTNDIHKMHRTSLENVYSFVSMLVAIYKVIPLTNSWLITFADDTIIQDDNIWVLSPEFDVISKTFSEISVNPIESHFIEKNNKLVYWVEGENGVWILDQFAEVVEEYTLDMTFYSGFYLYDGNYLVNLDRDFHYIINYYAYQWSRGVIEKFNLDLSYLIDDFVAMDTDQDGVDDSIDRCPNTETGFAVNSFGCSADQVLATDDLSIDSRGINIYPNPAQDKLFLSTSEGTHLVQLTIFDYTGKALYRAASKNYKAFHEIDLSTLTKGIYIVKMTFENGSYSERKFIVE